MDHVETVFGGYFVTEMKTSHLAFIVPIGGTSLRESDTALILVNKTNLPVVRTIFEKLTEARGT